MAPTWKIVDKRIGQPLGLILTAATKSEARAAAKKHLAYRVKMASLRFEKVGV